MQDSDLDKIYLSAFPISHFAGLRAVYDSGYYAGASQTVTPTATDQSLTQSAPAVDPTITTV